MLDLYEYDEIKIVLSNSQRITLTCYIKKHEEDAIEVHIINPYNVKINGKKGDFKYETTDQKDINLPLIFIFDPSTVSEISEEYKAAYVSSRLDMHA
uniref:Uncharacterized protein n=1 Tax=Panagrolaimus superbus TaxID=310955 RepID=A0A914Y0P4_9BILA